MTTSQIFTDDEMHLLNDVETAKSGTEYDQFIQECIELVRAWIQIRRERNEAAAPDTQAILFIFAEAPAINMGFANPFSEQPKKIRKKMGTLGEGIVVCNQNFRVMLKLCETLSIEDAYQFAEDHLSDSICFAIAKVGQFKLQIHRSGQDLQAWLEDPEEALINIDEVLITPDRIAQDLERFHHEYFSTPLARAARTMWSVPKGETQHVLGPQPEQNIQSYLLAHFDGLYGRRSVFVHEEVKNQGGRTDISIERPCNGDSGKVNTLLELKVLAPQYSFNKNHSWAMSGIEQADKYRNHDTDAAFACLFDARREKLEMPELAPYAAEKEVRLTSYSMGVPADKEPKTKSKAKKTNTY